MAQSLTSRGNQYVISLSNTVPWLAEKVHDKNDKEHTRNKVKQKEFLSESQMFQPLYSNWK